jgi:cytoskeletal protein CcmA (bactofilin family)
VGDLEVQGFVDGEVSVDGDVTVDANGMVGAGVRGRRLVVRGAVKGDLVGEEAVLLEEGARVVGDVRAPRVAIASGALVRGYVETGGESSAAPARVARPQAAARVAPPVTVAAKPAPAVAPVPATVAASKPAAGPVNNSGASARRAPPPVVPAMKKVKGQVAKRRER